jgi:hypothetical protein
LGVDSPIYIFICCDYRNGHYNILVEYTYELLLGHNLRKWFCRLLRSSFFSHVSPKLVLVFDNQYAYHCRNPNLGLATKAKACEGVGQVWRLGMWENVREWTPTLPSELPLWELEFGWTPKSSKSNFRGQNPLDWGVPYIITKLLKRRCLKWVCMTHLDTSNTSYGQKKGRESNCQIWLSNIKSRELPQFACMQVAWDIPLENPWQGLQLYFRLHLDQRLAHKIMALQSCRSPNFGNFVTRTWEFRNKVTFGCWSHGQAHSIL